MSIFDPRSSLLDVFSSLFSSEFNPRKIKVELQIHDGTPGRQEITPSGVRQVGKTDPSVILYITNNTRYSLKWVTVEITRVITRYSSGPSSISNINLSTGDVTYGGGAHSWKEWGDSDKIVIYNLGPKESKELPTHFQPYPCKITAIYGELLSGEKFIRKNTRTKE